MTKSLDLTIVVVSHNSSKTLRSCLQSLIDHGPNQYTYRIIVVDNASTDGSVDLIEAEFPDVEVLSLAENVGFGRGNNAGMAKAPARYYYLHNVDAYLQENIMDEALTYLDAHSETGVAGILLVFPDLRPQTAAYSYTSPLKWTLQGLRVDKIARWLVSSPAFIPLRPIFSHLPLAKTFVKTHAKHAIASAFAEEVDWVCGASLILRDEVRTALGGGFDPIYFLYAEDEDLCIESRKHGWRVEQLSLTPVIHDFGWGQVKKKRDKTVARIKLSNLELFVDKHFKNSSISHRYMKVILRLQRWAWGISR